MVRFTLTGVLTLACAAIAGAADIAIDPQTEYQTIEGFGFFAQCNQYGNTSYTDFIHNDLGVTMVRMDVPHDFEPSNDNGDPNSLDLSRYNRSGGYAGARAAVNGMKRFTDVKFIASVWTPPPWMKDLTRDVSPTCSDGAGMCGGHLRADMREELAELLYAFYRAIEQDCGVRLYGLSLQNEANFIEWYISCVYTPEEYRDALKAVGAKFQREGVSVKLFGAEDMVDATGMPGRDYAQKIAADSVAKRCIGAFAVHGYIDGVNPSSASIGSWRRAGGTATQLLGVPLWMTETSGFAQSWDGAMTIAQNIHTACRFGKLSAWVFWSDNECSTYGLLCNGAHTERSRASKNYYRYVRPGAVMIRSTWDSTANPSLFATAFRHRADQTLTVVVLNTGSATSVRLTGPGLPATLLGFVSTSSGSTQRTGLATSGAISIDANSVTTLYGTGYDPVVPVAAPAVARAATPVRVKGAAQSYTIHGRRTAAPLTSGVCLNRGGAKVTVADHGSGR